jgi:hypothetical protein
MIGTADEIPVTYLNKGQTYSVSIVDTAPAIPGPTPAQYRTSVRISFEDGQQGQKSANRWRLWKEGRGTTEAHKRGGKLQGVEYVGAGHTTEDESQETRVSLETAFLDGFSVLWTPGSRGSADCNIAVRFNFLSTDFSHSKGVEGILSRLCAKTEVISTGSWHDSREVPEICFCGVKLFRDHGAERKLLNDIEHVKKTIDKLQQAIAQVEIGTKTSGKRRRTGSIATSVTRSSGPGKVPKHKRTGSNSSASHSEEELQFKLQTAQDMFASTRRVSALCMRGREQDDPDLHPILLSGELLEPPKVELEQSMIWQQRISGRSLGIASSSTLLPPSPNPGLPQSRGIVGSRYEALAGAVPTTHGQRSRFKPIAPTSSELQLSNPQHLPSPLDQPVGTSKPQQDSPDTSAGWIEALDLDSGSRTPTQRPLKPGSFDIFMRSEKFC